MWTLFKAHWQPAPSYRTMFAFAWIICGVWKALITPRLWIFSELAEMTQPLSFNQKTDLLSSHSVRNLPKKGEKGLTAARQCDTHGEGPWRSLLSSMKHLNTSLRETRVARPGRSQCCKATSSFPPCWEGCSGGRRTQKSGVRAPSKVMWIWIEISAHTSSRARNELLSSY